MIIDRAILRMTQASVTLFAGPADHDAGGRSTAAGLTADGLLRVENRAAVNGCPEPSVGHYRWSLSAGGQHLTLEAADDGCDRRATFLAGEWLRSDCLNPDNQCLGVVEPGTYPSQFFSPRVPLGDEWRAHLGSLTYTVPAGWAASDDWPSTYGLMQAEAYWALWSSAGTPPAWPDAITVWARPAIVTGSDPCAWETEPAGGRTPAELAAAVAARPGIIAGGPIEVELGGRVAVQLDVRLADGWTRTCPDVPDGLPYVPLVAEDVAEGRYLWGIGGQDPAIAGSDPQRLLFVDIGGGDTVMVQVDSETEDGFETFLEVAMPVVVSFRFAD